MLRMPRYKYYFAISDFMILSVAFILSAYIITLSISVDFTETGLSLPIFYLFITFSVLVIYIFDKNHLYKINVILMRTVHTTALLKSLLFASAITFVFFILLNAGSASALSLITLIFVFSASLLFYFLRIEFYRRMILRVPNNFFRRNILIVGAGKSGKLMAEKILSENPYGINIVGFIDDYKKDGEEILSGKKILGRTEEIEKISASYYVDEAIIAINKIDYDRLLGIIDRFLGSHIVLKISSALFGIVGKNFSGETYGGIPVVDVRPSESKFLTIKIKRVIDIAGSLLGIILLSPLMLLIVVLIKAGSPGPVLFKQKRIGYSGKPFTFYKFRSMNILDGEDEERKKMMLEFMKNDQPKTRDTKVINDRRVTWIGRYIRKTSLDELPQLFNVLKGEMSLVGPRPCLPYEYENYNEWQRRRLSVLPGCTGVWQVSGRSSVSFNDSIVLDLYYVNNMSLFFDFRILLRTFPVMFLSKGGK